LAFRGVRRRTEKQYSSRDEARSGKRKEATPENVYRRYEKWRARISRNVTTAKYASRRLGAKFKGNAYEMKRGHVAHRDVGSFGTRKEIAKSDISVTSVTSNPYPGEAEIVQAGEVRRRRSREILRKSNGTVRNGCALVHRTIRARSGRMRWSR